jgi:hypothetical protein
MSSVISEFLLGLDECGQIRVVYFTEDVPASSGTRLAAAVIWRNASAVRSRGWRDLLRKTWHRNGPLGLGFSLGREAGLWDGSAGEHGEQETLYHPLRRVVRVLGKEYELPSDGQTLILMIDEYTRTGATPSVSVRMLRMPVMSQSSPDPPLDSNEAEEESAEFASEEHKMWAKALQSDPEVQAFMAKRSKDV